MFKYHAMKYVGVEVLFHALLTSALEEVSGQLHAPTALPPVKQSSYWGFPRDDLDEVVKKGTYILPYIEPRFSGLQALT
jgi:hypothetical protein